MKIPPAPESMRALVSTVFSVSNEMGTSIDWRSISAMITLEIEMGGGTDIVLVRLIKNPLSQEDLKSPPFLHLSIQPSWL